MPCQARLRRGMSCLAMVLNSGHVMPCYIYTTMLCHALICCVMLCHVMLHYVVVRRNILCYAVLCYAVVICHDTMWFGIL